jgi:hypothetical protein
MNAHEPTIGGNMTARKRGNALRRRTRRLVAVIALAAGVFAATSVPANAAVIATFANGQLTVFGDNLDTRSRLAATRRGSSSSTAVQSLSKAARRRLPTPR